MVSAPFCFRKASSYAAIMITEALVTCYPGVPFEYREVKLEDSIRDYEVLVEIKATGVCHTGTMQKVHGQ
jgi:Zn-dependent alcohol dehydrogenase